MNNCCKFNWFSTFVLHKNKTSVIQSLMKIARDNKNLVQNEIETIEKAIELLHENEKLKQEIENLKYKLQYLTDCGIEKEEKFKEMLRKCSPLYLDDVCAFCIFCKQSIDQDYYGHTDDCEYVRLCATDINVVTKSGGA